MSGRKRDYKAEYARRIARGQSRGLSRSQARGHPKSAEATARKQPAKPTYNRQLEEGLREIKQGKTLTAAAREVHVAPERLRRYLAGSGIAKKQGRSWTIGPDTRRREMLLFSDGEAITVTVAPDQAEKIGRYDAAVARFLRSNDPMFLIPFAGRSVTDVTGRSHPFETDPNELYRLAETGSSTFEDVYRIVV